MRNSWILWVFIVGVVITVLFAFNYQGGRSSVPLSEIFPEEEQYPVDIEYEFVEDEKVVAPKKEMMAAAKKLEADIPKFDPKATEAKVKQQQAQAEQAAQEIIQKAEEIKAAYTIQVASFRDRQKAENKLEEVKKKEYAGYIVARDLGSRGTWHRVYVGQFATKDDAANQLSSIKKDYPDSFMISIK